MKGELHLSYLIGGVIAIFVLIMVGAFAYSFFSGKAIPFSKYLPSFDYENEKIAGVESFRYLIREDKVQYYDGLKWNNFAEDNIEINEKNIGEKEIYEKLKNFYYRSRDRKKIEIERGIHAIIDPEIVYSDKLDKEPNENSRGDAVIYVYKDNKVIGWYSFSLENKLTPHIEQQIEQKINEEKIIEEALRWRDEAEETIRISEVNVCPEKVGEYLVINLREEKEKCNE